jgi:hypothetical protein
MSSPQGRKPKPESYAYSWFLPADGHNGSAVVSQLSPSELEATAEGAKTSEAAAMQARTEQWRRSGERRSALHQTGSSSLDLTRVRLMGMVGWSVVAASGAVLLVVRSGQSASTQLGVLAGVWFGLSAAIWFVPQVLGRAGK